MPSNRPHSPANPAAGLVHAPTRRYAEVSGYLNTMNALGAAVINVLVLAALWGQWRAFWTVLAIQVPMLVFNVWVNLHLLPRYGRKAEALRAIVGIGSGVLANQAAHWVLPVWLWLPYLAWALDHLERRAATWTLVAYLFALRGLPEPIVESATRAGTPGGAVQAAVRAAWRATADEVTA